MSKRRIGQIVAISLAATLLLSVMAVLAIASEEDAPLAQATVLRTTEVKGSLATPLSMHYLGLEPMSPDVVMKLTLNFDQPVNFWVLNEAGFRQVQAGERPSVVNLAAGNEMPNAPSNQLGAEIKAAGTSKYVVIVYNRSRGAASYTLKAENATLVDDAGQVQDALAPATPVTATAELAAPVTAPATATVAAAPTVTPTAATTTTAPAAAVVAQPSVVSGPELTGSLATPSSQHWLRLEPAERDAVMKLTLTYDLGANFWVLDDAGLRAVIAGARPHTVNVAAGNRLENAPSNQLSAEIKAAGLSKYTVIVYNDTKGPTSYTLKVEKGTLSDDSGQTTGAAMVETPTPPAEGLAVVAPEASPTPVVIKRTAKPGETYVVQAGDTLSLIAADIYGSSRLWEKLCIFNQLANCNVLRIGQVLNLPTLEQLNAIQVPSVGAAPAAPAAPAAEATPTPAAPEGEAAPTPTPAASEGEATPTPTPAAPAGEATPTPTPAS